MSPPSPPIAPAGRGVAVVAVCEQDSSNYCFLLINCLCVSYFDSSLLSFRWAEGPPVDKSDSSSAPTSEVNQGAGSQTPRRRRWRQQQQQQQQKVWGRPEARTMEDQRDLISSHEQLPMLGQRPGAPESKCSRGALYTGFSVLVALLLAGQATTAYFLYQQQGRLDKLTVTSQNLQLENLRMKLPKPSKPLNKMRVATPMLMQALPMSGLLQGPVKNATKYGNMTQDHVMHMLLEADPLKVYPKLKGSFPENLKHLKRTMETLDWKVFENWMYQWLLFEMSKNSLEDKPEVPLKEPLDLEDLSSGLGMTKPDLGQGKGPCRGHRAPAAYPPRGRIPHGQRAGVA
uniref:Ribosomal protein S14 n=1 Tax=Ailuropoda melanoleuca TaxID=9646 RepID=A0A7N5KDK3_AILME